MNILFSLGSFIIKKTYLLNTYIVTITRFIFIVFPFIVLFTILHVFVILKLLVIITFEPVIYLYFVISWWWGYLVLETQVILYTLISWGVFMVDQIVRCVLMLKILFITLICIIINIVRALFIYLYSNKNVVLSFCLFVLNIQYLKGNEHILPKLVLASLYRHFLSVSCWVWEFIVS